jgi:nitrate reductase gamma subunit
MSDYALFVIVPYVAAASLLAAMLSALLRRSDCGPRECPPMTARSVVAGHKLLTAGLLGGLGTHAALVAWPDRLARWNGPPARLLALESAFFLLGVAVLAGLGMTIARHLIHPPRRAATVIDVSFVGVLLVAVVSGLGIAVLHRWAAAWSAVTLAPYVRSVAALQPDLRYLESMPYLVKLHLFASSAVIAMIAFTTPVRLLLAAANRAVERALSPVGALLADRWRLFQDRARQRRWHLPWSEQDEYE